MFGLITAALAIASIDTRELDRLIEQKMAITQVPGVAVGIYHDGETHTAGYGITNFDHPLRVTDTTLFQIGSITKTFTGTIVMRLVEQGKLDLDGKVRTYLPDFRVVDEAASAKATVRHLLTHMGGWVGDYFDDSGTGADALPVIVGRMKDLEQLAPVGSVYSYNNSAFYVAGLLIESVTGKSYEEALQEMILEPLGITGCQITPGDVMTHRFAVGHSASEERGVQVLRPWYLARAAFPAGGLACDVNAMLLYARFHLGDGRPLFERKETLTNMHATQFPKIGTDEEMAITWHVTQIGGTRILSHGGGTLGQISLLQIVPERNFAVAITTNAGRGGEITRDVSRWVLQKALGLEIEDPEPMSPQPGGLADYAGSYRRPFADVDVSVEGDVLVLQQTLKQGFPTKDSPVPPPAPPARFQFFAKDRIVRIDGPSKGSTAEFIRKDDGSIGWLRLGGRIHPRR
jgi:CubicO group peptidase (beta-lactamase class C family)